MIATILVRGRQQLLEFIEQEIAVFVDRRPLDHRPLPLAQKMPGHDVGMVLHNGKHDLVARFDALTPERIGDQIDCLSGVASEDDLFLALGVQKRAHAFTRALVRLGCLIGEVMQTAVHIRVLLGIRLLQPVEHLLRLLCRGSVVEVDQRLAIDALTPARENPPGSWRRRRSRC